MGSLTDSVAKTWRKDMTIYTHKVFREMETQRTHIETNEKTAKAHQELKTPNN